MSKAIKRRTKPPSESWFSRLRFQLVYPALLAAIAYIYLQDPPTELVSDHHTRMPTLRRPSILHKCIFLSYQIPSSGLYVRGPDDAYFVAFWMCALFALREATMYYVWMPLARREGITKRQNIMRYAEQGWSVLYYSIAWLAGMYILDRSDYDVLDTKTLWLGYPHTDITALTKRYYLLQTAFWLQWIVVLHIEKRRKDHAQMFTHHIITLSLILLSYRLNYTRVGNAILAIMDLCDILLSGAKMLKYAGYKTACDVMFGIFMIAWLISRQIIYPIVLWSVYHEAPQLVHYDWDDSTEHYFTRTSQAIFVTLLGALQILLCWWFSQAIKVTIKVLKGSNAEDVRSDSEETSDEEDVDEEPSSRTKLHDNAKVDVKRETEELIDHKKVR